LNVLKLSHNRDVRIEIYKAAGKWLNENTHVNDKVGALEIGIIGYYSDRYMIDFAGLLQPSVASKLKTESTYEDTASYAIETYKPEFIVLHKNIFPNLEQQLKNQCVQVKSFNAKKYRAKYNMTILKCTFTSNGVYNK